MRAGDRRIRTGAKRFSTDRRSGQAPALVDVAVGAHLGNLPCRGGGASDGTGPRTLCGSAGDLPRPRDPKFGEMAPQTSAQAHLRWEGHGVPSVTINLLRGQADLLKSETLGGER